MIPALCNAIALRQVIRFRYRGELRVVEPFCYGLSAEQKELLRAYQLEGYSESGQTAGWKLFRVEEISDLSVATDVRAHYNPDDPAMATLFCRA